jgi:PD-(D/E)XK nuclease superfamily
MKTVYTDRSRIETYQRCPRLRWLEYHEAGTGLSPAKKSLPLAVGGSVHVGLQHLLLGAGEDAAVVAALDDFSTFKSALALDIAEQSALATALDPRDAGFNAQLTATAAELGMSPDDPALGELLTRQRNSAAEFDDWLYREQSALVEGMVRAYARRRLRPLLEEFEVLEVEREGQWLLSHRDDDPDADCYEGYDLHFMSRPDALLRSRADNSLYILSFKTAASWDIRKERDAQHDMQGLSEGVEVEKRLGEWWAVIHQWDGLMRGASPVFMKLKHECPPSIFTYLKELPSPPRILGIRYEYLLKGSRYADRDLAARFGLNVWAQRSHLIRAYANDAGQWCWSYDFLKDDGGTSKLYYKSWRPHAVWESMPMRRWIDMLDTATEAMSAYDSTTGAEPRLLGWHSDAQAQGYTTRHPLDEVFPAPLTVYRSDDQLRDWVEQVEAQERRVAEGVAEVAAAGDDDGERRHQLNVLFPMARRACSYPTECQFTKVCYGSEDAQRDPMATGMFKPRVPNHPQERGDMAAAQREASGD